MRKILIVDDCQFCIDTYKLMLMDFDYEMPDINGLEVLYMIRNTIRKNIPVIMISDSCSKKVINMSYQIGVNTYIEKSVLNENRIKKVIRFFMSI